jgi:hypothetical protein
VKREAKRRHIELVIVPTREAIRLIEKESAANAISSRDLLEDSTETSDRRLLSAGYSLPGIHNGRQKGRDTVRIFRP